MLFRSGNLSVFAQSGTGQGTAAAKSEAEGRDSQAKPKNRQAKEVEIDRFMRVRKNGAGKPEALETSITRYETVNAAGERVTVDLIGVVHIGEKEYYQELNKQFEQYDALLYELVAPEGTRVPKGGRGEGEIGRAHV